MWIKSAAGSCPGALYGVRALAVCRAARAGLKTRS